MAEDWDDDGKAKHLKIPGIALPNLRDMKIQFIGLIEFDLFLGPVVHLNEISRGSSYIDKLRNYQTLSEVYAGLARADIDIISTSEDEISIFRYDPDGNTDITSVLLISCVPGSDLELIKGIGSIAIKKSRANPEIIGRELSLGLREQFKSKLNYKTKSKENKLKMLYKGQPDMPLNNTVIKGIISIDFNTNTADFRNFSSWIDGIEILPEQFLNFIDLQLESIIPNKITSFIYKGIQLIGTTTENCKFFVFIHLSNLNVIALKKISEWFVAYVDILSKLGKFSSTNDIKRSLNLLNDAQNRDTEIKYFQNYLRMVLKGNKIYPAIIHENSFEIELPNYINKDSWNFLKNMDGAKSLNELLDHTESSSIDIITMIEWCRVRNLMNLLEK